MSESGPGRDPGRPHRPPRRPAAARRRCRHGPGHGHHRLPGQRHRGHQGAGHRAGRRRGRPPRRCSTPRRPRSGASWPTRPGTWCSASTTRPSRTPWPGALAADGLDPGSGRVADRGAGRLAAGQRARGQPVVPGLGGLLRLGGQVRRPRRARGTGGVRGGGPGHGRRRPPGARVPTSGCPSPGWPVPTPRTASRPARCSSAWPGPGTPTEAFGFNVPGDRDRVRQYATIAALDLLRRTLGRPSGAA